MTGKVIPSSSIKASTRDLLFHHKLLSEIISANLNKNRFSCGTKLTSWHMFKCQCQTLERYFRLNCCCFSIEKTENKLKIFQRWPGYWICWLHCPGRNYIRKVLAWTCARLITFSGFFRDGQKTSQKRLCLTTIETPQMFSAHDVVDVASQGSMLYNHFCCNWTAIKLWQVFDALFEMLCEFSSGHICACYQGLGHFILMHQNLAVSIRQFNYGKIVL